MSTLRVTGLKQETSTATNISMAVGGGVTVAGIATFHSDVTFASNISANSNILIPSGSLGIGTDIPAGRLQVGQTGGSNIIITPNIGVDINDGTLNLYTATSNVNATPLIISTDVGGTETEKLRVTAGGNLGIGTNAPTAKLHLYSDGDATLFIQADADNVDEDHNPKISMAQDGQTSSVFDIGITGSAGAEFTDARSNSAYIKSVSNATTQGIQFATNGASAMFLDNSAQLGISTTHPRRALHNANQITLTTGDAPQYRLVADADLEDTDDTKRAIFGLATASTHFFPNAEAGDAILRATDGGDIRFGNGQTEKLRLESSGALIGTAGKRIIQEVLKAEWAGTPDAVIYELDIENITNSGTSAYYNFRVNAWEDIGNMASMISYEVWIHRRGETGIDVDVVKLTPWHSKAIGFYHYGAATGDKRFVIHFQEDYSGVSIIDYTSDS